MKYRVLFQYDTTKDVTEHPSFQPDTHTPFTQQGGEIPLPPHLDHPAVETVCSVCETFKEQVAVCEENKCAFAYQRRGHEGRVRDDARNAAEKEVERGR